MVYADDHGEHGKENGAERGGLRKGADVLHGMVNVYFSVILFPPKSRGCAGWHKVRNIKDVRERLGTQRWH